MALVSVKQEMRDPEAFSSVCNDEVEGDSDEQLPSEDSDNDGDSYGADEDDDDYDDYDD